jgi:hypothetical protein
MPAGSNLSVRMPKKAHCGWMQVAPVRLCFVLLLAFCE